MQNGELFDQVRAILEDNEDIPARVSNALILASIKYNHALTTRLTAEVQLHGEKIAALEDAGLLATQREERNVTWPWMKDNVVEPIIRTGLTLIIGYIFLKVFGVAP